MKCGVLCAMVMLAPARGYADGIAIVGGSPRAIGRAGTATVGDDGGGALLINPAAIARRDTTRFQLGLAAVDDTIEWQSDAEAAPRSHGQAASQLAPLGSAIGSLHGWIIGVGAMTAAVADRALARPSDAADGYLGTSYDYRYAGIGGMYRRDTIALGIARRFGDSVALGISLGISQVRVREHRRIWAGFGAREPLTAPSGDVDLRFTAIDRFSPSAVAGVLIAPAGTAIELGASVAWADTARLDGEVEALGHRAGGPEAIVQPDAGAALTVRQPITVRTGGRYVGDRIVAEIDGDLWIAPARAESEQWSVHGVRVVDASAQFAELWRIPSRISQCTHVALRAAADIELMPGFLWAVGGYAFTTGGTPERRLSPTFGDLGGHTIGVGFETTSAGFTVALGWSRTWSSSTRAASLLELDNPFAYAGDGAVPGGTYDASIDQIGLLVELELDRLGAR